MQSVTRCAAVLLLAVLAGCSGEAPAPAAPARPAPAAQPVNEYTAAVAMGTPASGLKLQFRLAAAPRVDQPVALELKLTSAEPAQKGELRLEAEQGLALAADAAQPQALDPLAAGAEQTRTVTLVPSQEGVFLVKASISVEGLGGARRGEWGIPVMVTPPPPAVTTAPANPAAPAADPG